MATIQFYHLTATPLERALPKLLEKGTAAGFRSLVVMDSDEKVVAMDEWLWSFDPASFLPHGTYTSTHAAHQPILLSTHITDVNNAGLLMLTDGSTADAPDKFTRVLDIFDGRDETQVAAARSRWADYKNAGHQLTYFKQTENGGWSQPSA